MSRRRALRSLAKAVSEQFPGLADPATEIASGRVTINGLVVANPNTLVPPTARIALASHSRLRGEAKLQAALDTFTIEVDGRVALDLGASAGGFTRVLLARGAPRVYAVDAGYGQLRGSLRQDARVINLERTNLAALNHRLVPEPVGITTVDLSYLAVADALPQLQEVEFPPDAELVALVKPMFELSRDRPPTDEAEWSRAVALAGAGAQRAGWTVAQSHRSPVKGAGGAVEFFLHCRRTT